MIDLTFWMNIPSFYQSDLFRSLIKTNEVRLHVIFTGRIPGERLRLGWEDDLSGLEYEFLDPKTPVREAARKARARRNSVHVVNGLWAGKQVLAVLFNLYMLRSRYLIYSEAPDPASSPGPLKKPLTRLLGAPLVRNAAALLPISHFAADFFRSYGASEDRLFPFAYFREVPDDSSRMGERSIDDRIHLLFAGQLVRRKGLDILMEAVGSLKESGTNLQLHLVGSGDEESSLRKSVSEMNLGDTVHFEGALPPGRIIERLSRADLLVLPSRWDGWGLVVNEAFMAGTPVMVSDSCGAADLVKEGANGYIFKSNDPSDLRKKLAEFIGAVGQREKMKLAAIETGKALRPANAAEYLVRILKGESVESVSQSQKYPWIYKDK